MISVLPEYLRSAAMTAEWENRLLRIEKGELCGQEFLEGIVELIDRMLLECGFSLWKENRYLSGMKKMIDKKMAADGKAAFHLEFPKKKK